MGKQKGRGLTTFAPSVLLINININIDIEINIEIDIDIDIDIDNMVAVWGRYLLYFATLSKAITAVFL